MGRRLKQELRKLAQLLTATARSVESIVDELDREAEAAAGAGVAEPRPRRVQTPTRPPLPAEQPVEGGDPRPPKASPPEKDAAPASLAAPEASAPGDDASPAPEPEVPWDALVDAAITLLHHAPARVWKPAELCRAARDSGIPLASLQGVHFGLMPRLRERKAVEDVAGGFRASKSVARDAGAEPAAPQRRELPWPAIIKAALELLRADPDRKWGQAELCRAVRDSGVAIDNLQGVHFGLTSRLDGLGVAEVDADGKLRLSALAGAQETAPPAAPSAATGAPADEVDGLAEEIDACEFFLERMSAPQRDAQVAVWTGRARDLQDTWTARADVGPERRTALRRVFGRLKRIAAEQRCSWIDALTPEWVMSWDVYVAFHEALLAGEEPQLGEQEQQAFWRGKLRGLLLPARLHVSPQEAAEVIAAATALLDPADEDLAATVARFGAARKATPPIIRRAPVAAPRPSAPAAPVREVSPALLAAAAGKRALIVGGQGSREEHRRGVQEALGFAELDWVVSERGAAGHYSRLEERVRSQSYDVVLFLAGYTSHKAVPFLRQCRASGVPVVYLARGYGLAQICHALEEQWLPKASWANA